MTRHCLLMHKIVRFQVFMSSIILYLHTYNITEVYYRDAICFIRRLLSYRLKIGSAQKLIHTEILQLLLMLRYKLILLLLNLTKPCTGYTYLLFFIISFQYFASLLCIIKRKFQVKLDLSPFVTFWLSLKKQLNANSF